MKTRRRLPTHVKQLPGLSSASYALGGGQFGSDVPFMGDLDIDQSKMSVVIPFADGMRRDGVGDLLEVGGINTERHRLNPVVLFDHGKHVALPIAISEDPDNKAYTVEIDTVGRVARGKAYFYQGTGIKNVSREDEYNHAVFCEQLFHMIANRFVRGGSIGYQVLKAMNLNADYDTGVPAGLHLLAVLMLEYSAVVLPANGDTVRKAFPTLDEYNAWEQNIQRVLWSKSLCGKPLSGVLVKSLTPYVPEPKRLFTGYGHKSIRPRHVKGGELISYRGWNLSVKDGDYKWYAENFVPPAKTVKLGPFQSKVDAQQGVDTYERTGSSPYEMKSTSADLEREADACSGGDTSQYACGKVDKKVYQWNGQSGQQVRIVGGEHAGRTAVVEGQTPKRYAKEDTMMRVVIDEPKWPIGVRKTTIDARFLEAKAIDSMPSGPSAGSTMHDAASAQQVGAAIMRNTAAWPADPDSAQEAALQDPTRRVQKSIRPRGVKSDPRPAYKEGFNAARSGGTADMPEKYKADYEGRRAYEEGYRAGQQYSQQDHKRLTPVQPPPVRTITTPTIDKWTDGFHVIWRFYNYGPYATRPEAQRKLDELTRDLAVAGKSLRPRHVKALQMYDIVANGHQWIAGVRANSPEEAIRMAQANYRTGPVGGQPWDLQAKLRNPQPASMQKANPGVGWGGGTVNVPITPEREQLITRVYQNRSNRDALRQILGSDEMLKRYYMYAQGGMSIPNVVIRIMGWDKALADTKTKNAGSQMDGNPLNNVQAVDNAMNNYQARVRAAAASGAENGGNAIQNARAGQKGLTAKDVAEVFGITPAQVNALARKLGINAARGDGPGKLNYWSEQDMDKIAAELKKTGQSKTLPALRAKYKSINVQYRAKLVKNVARVNLKFNVSGLDKEAQEKFFKAMADAGMGTPSGKTYSPGQPMQRKMKLATFNVHIDPSKAYDADGNDEVSNTITKACAVAKQHGVKLLGNAAKAMSAMAETSGGALVKPPAQGNKSVRPRGKALVGGPQKFKVGDTVENTYAGSGNPYMTGTVKEVQRQTTRGRRDNFGNKEPGTVSYRYMVQFLNGKQGWCDESDLEPATGGKALPMQTKGRTTGRQTPETPYGVKWTVAQVDRRGRPMLESQQGEKWYADRQERDQFAAQFLTARNGVSNVQKIDPPPSTKSIRQRVDVKALAATLEQQTAEIKRLQSLVTSIRIPGLN